MGRTEGRAEEDEEDEEKGHKSTFLTPSDAATALAHHDSLILSFRLPRRQPAPITTDGRREEGRKGGRKEGSHSTAPPSPSPSPEEPIPIRPTSLFYSLSLSSLKCVWPRPDNQAAVVLLPFRGQRGQRHYTSSVSAATGRRKAAREGGQRGRERERDGISLSLPHSIYLSGGGFIYKCEERECSPPTQSLTHSLSTLATLEGSKMNEPLLCLLVRKSNSTIKTPLHPSPSLGLLFHSRLGLAGRRRKSRKEGKVVVRASPILHYQ